MAAQLKRFHGRSFISYIPWVLSLIRSWSLKVLRVRSTFSGANQCSLRAICCCFLPYFFFFFRFLIIFFSFFFFALSFLVFDFWSPHFFLLLSFSAWLIFYKVHGKWIFLDLVGFGKRHFFVCVFVCFFSIKKDVYNPWQMTFYFHFNLTQSSTSS